MSTVIHRSGLGRRRARLLGACLAVACAILLLGASAALADVQWQLASQHGPQNMAPGGTGEYVLIANNVGDADTDGSTITITDTLPAGMTATNAFGRDWDCSTTTFGVAGGTVTCTTTDVVNAPSLSTDAVLRGAANPLHISVSVDPSASGTLDNSATVSGGSGGAAPATVDDPTPISTTPAGFGFVSGSVFSDWFDAAIPGGSPVRQAGSHPFEMRIGFGENLTYKTDTDAGTSWTVPAGDVKTLQTKLPTGFIGDPQATPQCSGIAFNDPGPASDGACPADTQVGSIDLVVSQGEQIVNESTFGTNVTQDVPVYNMAPPPGTVAALAFQFVANPVIILISLDPTDHYSVVARIENTNEIFTLRSATLTLWGVPADPAHDALRQNPLAGGGSTVFGTPSDGPLKPFLTLPSQCGVDGTTQLREDSWQNPGAFTPWTATDPIQVTGCDDPRMRFQPSITVQPDVHTPSTPTGLSVDLAVPQKDASSVTSASQLYTESGDFRAIANPPVRNVSVTLPAGLVVSPSSADGLASCTSAQIGLGTNDQPACPDASKIGTAELTTPLLHDPVDGSVYLAAQTDNPFGSLLALYIVLDDPSRGLVIKLPGRIAPDAVTGQLTATFDDNPQLPFSRLHLQLKGGPRAPLVTPPACGSYRSDATMTSWNDSVPAAQSSDTFAIDSGCAASGFDPSFTAGTESPIAGKDSPLVTRFGRGDSDQELGSIDMTLPRGLLGRISSAVLCSDADANAGSCPDGSKIGGATVAAGPGSNPFYITNGRVYITGPYKGAPFGLSIVVPAIAGPFNLGNVVVRGSIFVDRTTSALRVVTDQLPTILQGIPLKLRLADVTVDRPGFMFNPTSCAPMSAIARITSVLGAVSTKTSRFQVGDCRALPFRPSLSLAVGSPHHTGADVSTPLTATVRMPRGDTNLHSVDVTLPSTLAALLPVLNRRCTLAAFEAGHCGSGARVGSAVAVTPLLRDPLRGSVYFVRNPAHALPDLMVALRGQVAIDLTGTIRIGRGNRIATHFDTIPDVPISVFTMRLVSGRNGPLGATTNLCSAAARRSLVQLGFQAQDGAKVSRSQRLVVHGCPRPRHGRG
ncbi:MAG TPA: hypothetical protein VFU94_13435 [Conexibacter sp.]|nr:hypothetical protein [Conexibacter sp.]